MHMIQRACGLGVLLAGVTGITAAGAQSLPDRFYPESIARASDGTLFVGSATASTIVRIPPGADEAQPFIAAGANGLMSAQGLFVDDAAGRLYACTGDLGVASTPTGDSALLAFELRDGSEAGRWPLPGGGFCNDLAAAPGGGLFVSDTAQPRILRFDPDSGLTTWAEDPLLGGADFNGNGIVVDQDWVYLVTFGDGRLLRVPITAEGTAGAPESVVLPRPLAGADALRQIAPGVLAVFENDIPGGNGRVTRVNLEGGQATLTPMAEGLDEPTSGIITDDRVIVLQSQFRKLFGSEQGAEPGPFELLTIPVSPAAHESVELPQGTQYPNGIAVDGDGGLFVGQVFRGEVLRRDPSGEWSVFYPGSETVFAGTSLRFDTDRNLLWGASPDFLAGDQARASRIFILDAANGTLRRSLTLPDNGFGNDIALGPDGAALITDTRNGRILRIEPDSNTVTILADDPVLTAEGGIGAAGIVIANDGRLIVGNYGQGIIIILTPGADGVYAISQMQLPRPLTEPDGMLLRPDGSLILVEGDVDGGDGRVIQILDPLADGVRPIVTLLSGLESPVNLTAEEGDTILVSEARIRRRILDGPDAPIAESFRLIRIDSRRSGR